jgi:hypothetical protein
LNKTKLPGDTYEMWLGNQKKKRPARAGGQEGAAPDSYETWIVRRVEIKMQETGTKKTALRPFK